MFRRTISCVSALVVLGLAACQDSGPLAPIQEDQEAFDLQALLDAARKVERPVAPPWNPPVIRIGGPAAVHVGSPNLLANGGFETGDFSGWSAQATGSGFGGVLTDAWQVGANELAATQGLHPLFPHAEALNNTGSFGATAVQSGPTNYLLVQDLTLPTTTPSRFRGRTAIRTFSL